MSSYAVRDCLGVKRHAGYHRFAVLLGDLSDPQFLDCLPPVFSCLYATLVHWLSNGLICGLFPSHSSTEILFFFRNSLGGCFIVAITYLFGQNAYPVALPNVARYKLLHGAFVRKQLSESPMAMSSGKVQSLFLQHWR